jgi:peptide/nickel transport system permease protein
MNMIASTVDIQGFADTDIADAVSHRREGYELHHAASVKRSAGLASFALIAVLLTLALMPAVCSTLNLAQSPASNVVAGIFAQSPEEIPVADAGEDQTVTVGERVYLDAGGSTDDVGVTNYTWEFIYAGIDRTRTGEEISYVFQEVGIYNITLTVGDAEGHTDTDVVVITVVKAPTDYISLAIWSLAIGGTAFAIVVFFRAAVKGKIGFISAARREKIRLEAEKLVKITRQLLSNTMGLLGIVILVVFVLLAIFGPVLAPYPISFEIGEGRFDKNALPSEFAVDAPSYVLPLKLALPLFVSLFGAAALLMYSHRRPLKAHEYGFDKNGIMVTGIFSAAILSVICAHAFTSLEIESPEWFGVASVAAVSLLMASITIDFNFRNPRATAGFLLSMLAPLALLAAQLVGVDGSDSSNFIVGGYFVAGVMLMAGGSYVRASRLHDIRSNPQILGTPVAVKMRRSGGIVMLIGVMAGSVVMLTGFLTMMQASWTEHWMGTDVFGYDILSELLVGARTSMIIGITSAFIASVVGAAVGLYSGYAGGWKDEVMMRLNDIVLSIPWLVLMIIIAGLLRTIDLTGIILIIGFTGWSPTARMVRSQVLSLKERQYVERARAIGSSDANIIRRHILPNAFPLVFANTILIVAVSILSESALSFLGLRPIGTVTWGTMLSYASDVGAFRIGLHWWILAPGICIVLVVLGFTLLGYALDDILNPKLRKR